MSHKVGVDPVDDSRIDISNLEQRWNLWVPGTAMGRCLFHLQRDLVLETWRMRTEEPPMTQPRAQICAQLPADQLQRQEN